jgi:hypothetical protein
LKFKGIVLCIAAVVVIFGITFGVAVSNHNKQVSNEVRVSKAQSKMQADVEHRINTGIVNIDTTASDTVAN